MQLPLVIEKLLDDIARDEGFTNYRFELESGSNRGDNYQGVMVAVKLIGDRVKDGVVTSETLHLICKKTPDCKDRRDVLGTVLAFEREIHMYTRVLPAFVRFQEENGLAVEDSFLSFPKVYAWMADEVNETYALILENVRPKQFVMWPRQNAIDLSHEKLFFTQLGRFHGVSFAMKDQRPTEFFEFKKLDDIITDWMETRSYGDCVDGTIEMAINVLEKEEHKNVMRNFRNNYLDTWKSFFTKEAVDKFGVVAHGDCWINNLMFQYNKNTKEVQDICFIDFQLSRYASPVLDIFYHVFSSTAKPLRDQSYEDLLNIYHTSLSDTVRRLGSDPQKLFSFSDLQAELKAYGKFALIMGTFLLPYVHFPTSDLVDMEEYAENFLNGEKTDMFKTDGRGNAIYVKAVNELVGDIISYGYDYDNSVQL